MRLALRHPTLVIGLCEAHGLRAGPSDAVLLAALNEAEQALRDDGGRYPEDVRVAVRDVLRHGGYKPTGRGKPASEYLLGQARAEGLPRIQVLVDICNLASLRSGFPISVFDAALLGPDAHVRMGREGESYVFNASGQSMVLGGLPVVCRGEASEPVGNAVKDAMTCKVRPATEHALYCVYASRALPPAGLASCLDHLRTLLEAHAGAEDVRVSTLSAA